MLASLQQSRIGGHSYYDNNDWNDDDKSDISNLSNMRTSYINNSKYALPTYNHNTQLKNLLTYTKVFSKVVFNKILILYKFIQIVINDYS